MCSFNFSNEHNKIHYKINFMGMHVADCSHSYYDTTMYDFNATKLSYEVKTKGIFNYFFKVDNNYEIIIDNKTFRTLLFKKRSSQPKIINNLETEYVNDKVVYPNNVEFKKKEISIFGILHLININLSDKIKSFESIDREGKKYNFSINNYQNIYEIKTDEIDFQDKGSIIDTDIFTWGLFLSNSNKYIHKNNEDNFISKCVFKKGLMKITAEIKNPN